MIKPEKEEYLKLAEFYDVIPVYSEMLADTETPVSVLARFIESENTFLLESVEGGETWGRYSFVGIEPQLLLEVDHSNGRTGKLAELRKIYQGLRIAEMPGVPRFFGGAVGYIGYEAMSEFERMPLPRIREGSPRPVSKFLKADRLIVFDNVKHTLKIVVCTTPKKVLNAGRREIAREYDEAVGEIERITKIIRTPAPLLDRCIYPAVKFESNMTRDEFLRMVKKAKEYIIAGDIIQVVLSQRFSTVTQVPPFQLYRALRLLNPSPYMFFIKMGSQILVGSSPEVMVRLTGNRVELRPIAGTRPRGLTEHEDRKLADELLSDEKEKAEHVMLVDLGRNDLGRVSEPGSVQVTEYMVIEKYSHVMHMVSHVQGILRREFDAFDVIRATFPAGTLTGAPKIRAMEIIHELEPETRGAHGGAVGYISYTGNMDLAITIRTIEANNGIVSVQAGAGVVYDSDPEREFDETCHKARALQKSVELAISGFQLEE